MESVFFFSVLLTTLTTASVCFTFFLFLNSVHINATFAKLFFIFGPYSYFNVLINVLSSFLKKNNAFFLAQNLKDDECCPVCGSKNHPKLAEKPIETPEESILIQAHKTIDDAIQNAETLLSQKQSEENRTKTQIEEKEALLEKNKIEFSIEDLTLKINETNANYNNTNTTIEKCRVLKEEIENLSNSIKELEEKETKQNAELQATKKELETVKKENFGKADFELSQLKDELSKELKEFSDQHKTLVDNCSRWELQNNSITQTVSPVSLSNIQLLSFVSLWVTRSGISPFLSISVRSDISPA